MSYQYQQYPQYPQPPARPQLPIEGTELPPTPDPIPDTYVPIPSSLEWAEAHSIQLSNIAAGRDPIDLSLKIPGGQSARYPFLMYNQKDGSTKAAKDEKEKADLAGKGYGENPPPPDPNAVTPEMLQALQAVWVKAGEELKRLTELVDQQQKQMQAAGNVLQAQQSTPGYPAGD